tara:strand:+ start:1559 stop:2815 length:1257 start_codon:yes stop_codon:yes gene_type:complete
VKQQRFICDLPWKHLSVHPHGNCSICCVADHSYLGSQALVGEDATLNVLNVSTDSIESIVNSDSYKTIRKEMLEGKKPLACKTCWDVEESGGRSKRVRDSVFDVNFDEITRPDGSIEVDLSNIELRLGNFCNLKCRSCNAESSTSWIDDYYKLKDKVPLPSNFDKLKKSKWTNYNWVEDTEFYNRLIKNSPNIRQLHISGGEPFLVHKHFYLLEKLVEDNLAKDIDIFYITNGNYNFKKLIPVLDKLNNFHKVYISFSLDDIWDRNAYIRKLSNFKLTIDNIKNFLNNYNFYYTITQTISTYNFLYCEELSQYLLKEGLYNLEGTGKIPRIIPNHVHAPAYQNATVIPKVIRQEKLNSIKNLVHKEIYNDLYGRYYNAPENNELTNFFKVTNAVDKVRKEKMQDYFPELFNVLKSELI